MGNPTSKRKNKAEPSPENYPGSQPDQRDKGIGKNQSKTQSSNPGTEK